MAGTTWLSLDGRVLHLSNQKQCKPDVKKKKPETIGIQQDDSDETAAQPAQGISQRRRHWPIWARYWLSLGPMHRPAAMSA